MRSRPAFRCVLRPKAGSPPVWPVLVRCGRVAFFKRLRHGRESDRAGPSAIKPWAWNLLLQSAASGSQSSISILESEEGARTIAARQCALRINGGAAWPASASTPPRPTGAPAAAACAAPGPVGGTKGPSGHGFNLGECDVGQVGERFETPHGVWPNAAQSAPEKVRGEDSADHFSANHSGGGSLCRK